MALADTIRKLYTQGLGELLILHVKDGKSLLGYLYFEKGRLALRDQGLLTDMAPAQLQSCWTGGLLGAVCGTAGQQWESMTFYGLEQCNLPVDLGKTRHGALVAAQNQYGESLLDFVGSIYRGYQLMLEHHFLPVILLKEVSNKQGEIGLAVSDMRTIPMSISMIRNLNDTVWQSVKKRLTMAVDDEQVDQAEFEEMFGSYLKNS